MPRDFNEPYYGFEDDVAKGLCEEHRTCPECGALLFDGDRIYTGHNTDVVIGCEHCIDYKFA